jgi:Translation initiation factor IF-2, N-terminal region.
MSKIRIHEYAKEKGLTSKEIIDFLESKNIEVKSHMSSLEDDVLKVLDAEFNKNAKGAAQKSAGSKPAAKQNSKQNQQKNNNNKNQKISKTRKIRKTKLLKTRKPKNRSRKRLNLKTSISLTKRELQSVNWLRKSA